MLLARKYPNADRKWGWQWAFPVPTRYFDREAKIDRRHHRRETVVQKAMRQAVVKAGIGKAATPHVLRPRIGKPPQKSGLNEAGIANHLELQ